MSSASSYQPVSGSDRSIPFYWLPEDVLIRIFSDSLVVEKAGGGYRLYSTTINHPLIMRLSHVSRRFRAVALNCPTLWTTIDSEVFPSSSFATAFVLRSQNEPIDITITKDYLTQNIFNILLSSIHRWRSLSLGADDDTRTQFEAAMNLLGDHEAPNLERLSIGSSFKSLATGGDAQTTTTILSRGAPSLKHLEIMTHALFLPLNRDSITHLTLTASVGSGASMTYTQFLDILSSFPSLTNLKLVGKMAKEWPAIHEIQPLRNSKIRSLDLSLPDDYDATGDLPHHYIFSMLASLTTETLENLTVTGFAPDTVKTFLRLLQRGNLRFPNVRWLCWYDDLDEVDDEDYDAITTYFPAVETLTFMEQDTFLEYLSTNSSVWPRLRSLNGCHVDVSVLRKIVSSRVKAAHPVKDVWLEGRWLQKTSDLSWIMKRVKLTTGVFHQMPTWRLT